MFEALSIDPGEYETTDMMIPGEPYEVSNSGYDADRPVDEGLDLHEEEQR